mmetsp:Transcript_26540/g.54771  ORF Transcript_26540/g.54771 Transcript_26540/m.54771 type:complete len:125 (-) Transcript_26540:1663-2037(-)
MLHRSLARSSPLAAVATTIAALLLVLSSSFLVSTTTEARLLSPRGIEPAEGEARGWVVDDETLLGVSSSSSGKVVFGGKVYEADQVEIYDFEDTEDELEEGAVDEDFPSDEIDVELVQARSSEQ